MFLQLDRLGDHWPTVLLAALGWQTVMVISQFLSPRLSQTYRQMTIKDQSNWNVRVVALVHSVVICWLAFGLRSDKALQIDKLRGYSYHGGQVMSVAIGFFLWDTMICVVYYADYGLGFLLHGIASLSVFTFSLTPFAMYYGGPCLLFEASTPFLNFNWFLNKCGYNGTVLHTVNGLCLALSFLIVRLIMGWPLSYEFLGKLYEERYSVPMHLLLIYGTTNIFLNSLNAFWFYKIVQNIVGATKVQQKIKKIK